MFEGNTNRLNPIKRKCWFRTCPRERTCPVAIDIPCSNVANRRNTEPGPDDVYRDADLIIDQNGLRRVSPSIFPLSGIHKGGKTFYSSMGSSFPNLNRSPRTSMDMDVDDDCLSIASTQTGEASFPLLSLSPQAQPSLALNKHETSISSEQKFMDGLGLQFNRSGSNGNQPIKPSTQRFKSSDLRLKNLLKVREVGRGSSGVVYRVHEKQSGQVWALKEVPLPADEEKRRMTVDELRTAHSVDHINIVNCCEVFYSRGVFSLVMDFMDGGSLLDNLKAAKGRLMPLGALAHVGRSIAAALTHLHEEVGVVHRDVKPGNILLTCHGDVKLADLGICTRPGELRALPSPKAPTADGEAEPATAWVGTVTYMSPERLTGCGYSFSADVWSLGIVLAESALGRYPYCLSPTARAATAGTEARSLQFWDLLDLVLDGPCPSRIVAQECVSRASAEEAQVLGSLVAWCLDRDSATRISARAAADHAFLAADQGAGRLALGQWQSLVQAGRDGASGDTGGGPLQQTLERSLEGLLNFFSCA